jgi:lysophosphatidate acyltransferase
MTFLSAVLKYAIAPFLIINTTLFLLSYTLPSTLLGGHPRRLAGFFARAQAFFGCLLFCANYGIAASIVFRLIGKPGLAQWATARAFKYTMYATTGAWMEIEDELGELRTRPMVLVGNHQTYVLHTRK